MLESIPVSLIIGTVLGFLAGLGIGGGSLLILWLTMVLNVERSIARGVNLLFFLPAAVISAIFRWKQGSIHMKKILPAMASGCLAAITFSWLGNMLDTSLLKKAFGILLILTGLRELFYKSEA